ncbi:MAG TPA: ABC transporter ATP-binding protein [Kiritimatiellia bacterium]|nr:ABC transporter ATP-binding protein [Kiritimatiellia bacterium]
MTSDAIIQVENLSKQYRLGEVSTGTLGYDLNRWWHRVRGKEDPYLRVTQSNIRDQKGSTSEYVWALNEITFEVKRGEVLGIIGRNGAGKSTLLKLLSRVTAPTTGEIRIDGLTSSLLEVGTGFHPDLTGRENIFMNGAILGMSKAEIRSKLDAIVEFSGCARYLDTPTKRYSSGMVVRLGFAVAAHLEPDILIVDEVLAVGDAEFQRKCIGKMQDVAGHGRTVLFVSHNMDSIRALTSRCLVIHNGRLMVDAPTEEAVDAYLGMAGGGGLVGPVRPVGELVKEKHLTIDPAVVFTELGLADDGRAVIDSGGTLSLEVGLRNQQALSHLTVGYTIRHESTTPVLNGYSPEFELTCPGGHRIRLDLQALDLAPGFYDLHLSVNRGGLTENKHGYDILFGVARFQVTAQRLNGDILPPWKSGWGHVLHTEASLRHETM